MADSTEQGWYHRGVSLGSIWSMIRNDSGEDIRVLPAEQIRRSMDYAKRMYGKPPTEQEDVD